MEEQKKENQQIHPQQINNSNQIPPKAYVPSGPIVTEEKLIGASNIFLAFFLGIVTILLVAFAIAYFDPTMTQAFIIIIAAVLFYSGILLFLLEPKILRKVHTKEIQYIDRPVVKEVVRIVEKPVIHEVIKTVEKPIIRRIFVDKPVEKEVVKRIFFEKERKKLNIPKYEFIGSSQTKTYHKRSCRLGKSIKRKYKISNNSEEYFKKKGFTACKLCMKAKKKSKKK